MTVEEQKQYNNSWIRQLIESDPRLQMIRKRQKTRALNLKERKMKDPYYAINIK
mgnify:CR=1 FL=1|jgi:hypothetical protein